MIFPFIIGVVLTAMLLLISVMTGLARERGVYPVTLMAIALFYIVFAFEHGGPTEIIVQSMIGILFFLLAILGYKTSLYIVAAGLIMHGLFDMAYSGVASNPSPEWWAPLCLAIDVVLGVFLIFSIKIEKVENRAQSKIQ